MMPLNSPLESCNWLAACLSPVALHAIGANRWIRWRLINVQTTESDMQACRKNVSLGASSRRVAGRAPYRDPRCELQSVWPGEEIAVDRHKMYIRCKDCSPCLILSMNYRMASNVHRTDSWRFTLTPRSITGPVHCSGVARPVGYGIKVVPTGRQSVRGAKNGALRWIRWDKCSRVSSSTIMQ
ncbi:hypothetical protein BKA93DRAFT_294377 [Sparassis latifolia]